MTRSQRRVNAYNAKIHNVSSTDHECLECGGRLVRTRGITHVCTRCGLIQEVERNSPNGDE